MGEEFNGIGDADHVSATVPNSVAAVVFKGWSEVPSGSAVGGPGLALGGFVVDDHFGARRVKRSMVVVEGSKELGIGREFGVDAKRVQEL